jgi:hypothetical protein
MTRFARLGAQQAQELGQNNTATCSTRPSNARVEPAPALGPARATPSHAKLTPAPVPIKPTEASTVRPRSLSTSLDRKITDDRSAHGVPAAAQEPTTVDRPP